jgi:HlyD family secretion protein
LKRALLAAAVVIALAAVLVASLRGGGGKGGTKVYAEPAAARDVVQVVKASGQIDPKEKVNISAHVVGKIDKLYVQEGDSIRAGQPFLKLEQQAFLAARDQWAAQLRSSETAVAKAQAMLADSEIKVRRARSLNGQGILSREQLDSAELATTASRLELDQAREAVREARANLDKAADDLTKTTIYAPIAGRVIKLNAEQGEVVVSGTMNNPGSVIGTIADLSEILAKVDVDETEVVNVKVGQSAVLKVDAVPGRPYHGRVIEVGSSGASKASQPDVTFFEVKIQLTDADEALRPGMSVRAEIRAAEHGKALAVPIQAVVERPAEDVGAAAKAGAPGGRAGRAETAVPATDAKDAKDDQVKVVLVVDGGKARLRQVATGLADETHVEILSGLRAGERVVTGPYRTLRDMKDGDRVAVSATSESEDLRREGAKEGG